MRSEQALSLLSPPIEPSRATHMKLSQMNLKGDLNKEVLVDVSASIVHSVPAMISLAKVWQTALGQATVLPTSVKVTNSRVLSMIRNSKPGKDLPTTVIALLPNVGVNLQYVSEYVLAAFPPVYNDANTTVKKKVSVSIIFLAYHIYVYLADYVNIQLQMLTDLEKDQVDSIPKRKKEEMEDGLSTFAIAMDVLGTDPNHFIKYFDTKYPEVPATGDIDALLAANNLDNPLIRVKDGFRGNPFFSMGMWANTVIVDYVRYMDDRLRVARLYLDELKAITNGAGNPATVKEIELLNDEIADIEYRIHKATTR